MGIPVSTMAVDPNGGVYVAPIRSNASDVAVAKLNNSGSGMAWTFSTGITFPNGALPTLAADASGRVYVAGLGTFFRIAANGASIEYQQPLVGLMNSIAVDASGAAFVAGGYVTDGILARFAPDGTPGFNTKFPDSAIMPTVALDLSGNAVVFSRGTGGASGPGAMRLTRYDANGSVVSSATPVAGTYPVMGMDQEGNVYLTGNAGDVTWLRSGRSRPIFP
jgi:sugar lactone lactonase YvrE